VVDAVRFSGTIPAATSIVTPKACEALLNPFPKDAGFYDMINGLLVACDFPAQDEPIKRLVTLNWFYLQMGKITPFNIHRDLRQFVNEKFKAHGKKLATDRETEKAVNTEKVFTGWKVANVLRSHQFRARSQAIKTPTRALVGGGWTASVVYSLPDTGSFHQDVVVTGFDPSF
jgi:hypothetical protein